MEENEVPVEGQVSADQAPEAAKQEPESLVLRPRIEHDRKALIDEKFGRCLAGHYRTVLLDPPWPEKGGGKIKRGADRHYEVAPVKEMPRIILQSPWNSMPDAHMYMWATNTHLMSAGWLMETLGFRYITAITWAKERIGIGQYFRGQTEHLLFGVRGKGLQLRRAWSSDRTTSTLLKAAQDPVRVHSRKPGESFDLIERLSPGRRIELFGRGAPRDGWQIWGNEGSTTPGEPDALP